MNGIIQEAQNNRHEPRPLPLPSPLEKTVFTSWGAYEQQVLQNGAKLHLSHFPNERDVFVAVVVNAGGRSDPQGKAGLAHLLEHLVVEISSPLGILMSEIKRERGGRDASMNATTGYDSTTYQLRCPSSKAPDVIKALAERIRRPDFPEATLRREKNVIYAEHSERQKPNVLDTIRAYRAIFPDADLKQVSGTFASVKAICTEDLTDFHQKHYVGPAISVFVTGNMAGNLRDIAAQQFSSISAADQVPAPSPVIPIWREPNASRCLVAARIRQRIDCTIYFPLPSRGDPDEPIASIFPDLMTFDMRSPIYQRMRLDSGLTYSPTFQLHNPVENHCVGALGFSVVSRNRIEEVFQSIRHALRDLCESELPSPIVEVACERKKDSLYNFAHPHHMRLVNSPRGAAPMCSVDAYKELLSTISPADVQRVAQNIFSDAFVSISGRLSPLADYRLFTERA